MKTTTKEKTEIKLAQAKIDESNKNTERQSKKKREGKANKKV